MRERPASIMRIDLEFASLFFCSVQADRKLPHTRGPKGQAYGSSGEAPGRNLNDACFEGIGKEPQ